MLGRAKPYQLKRLKNETSVKKWQWALMCTNPGS